MAIALACSFDLVIEVLLISSIIFNFDLYMERQRMFPSRNRDSFDFKSEAVMVRMRAKRFNLSIEVLLISSISCHQQAW